MTLHAPFEAWTLAGSLRLSVLLGVFETRALAVAQLADRPGWVLGPRRPNGKRLVYMRGAFQGGVFAAALRCEKRLTSEELAQQAVVFERQNPRKKA